MSKLLLAALGGLALFAPLGACATEAPGSPAALVDFASSAEVQALVAKAKASIKPDQPLVVQPLLRFSPYAANLEYRKRVGVSAIHETDAEVFAVVEGSGVLQTGGTMVGVKRTGPHDVTGTGLEGAVSRRVAKGDFLVVPEGVPHWFSTIDGTLVLVSLHVPRGAAAP